MIPNVVSRPVLAHRVEVTRIVYVLIGLFVIAISGCVTRKQRVPLQEEPRSILVRAPEENLESDWFETMRTVCDSKNGYIVADVLAGPEIPDLDWNYLANQSAEVVGVYSESIGAEVGSTIDVLSGHLKTATRYLIFGTVDPELEIIRLSIAYDEPSPELVGNVRWWVGENCIGGQPSESRNQLVLPESARRDWNPR